MTAMAVAAGNEHTGAITFDGQVWAWGLNDSSQLGNHSDISESTPVKVGKDYIRTYIPAASTDEADRDIFFVDAKLGSADTTVKAKYITSLNVLKDEREDVKFIWSSLDNSVASVNASGANGESGAISA